MAATRNSTFDSPFYQPADKFFPANSKIGLTFDDITLATLYSEILPRDTQLDTTLADGLHLNIPVISSDMDTVTESRMAIAMALNGGLGLIHYNMPEREQLSQVSRVKYHVQGLIQEPIKVAPDQAIGDVLELIEERKFGFSTFPVVDAKGIFVGLLSSHVVKPRYAAKKISEALTPRRQVHTIRKKELGKDPIARADKFFTEHIGIHKLLVVDEDDRLHGLITLSDVERIQQERKAQFKPARDAQFRLLLRRGGFGHAQRVWRTGPRADFDPRRRTGGARRGCGRRLHRARIQQGRGRHGQGVARRVSETAHHRRQRDERGGRGISGRLRRERRQGGAGAGFDLHDAHRRGRGHSATDGALCRFARGGKEKSFHPRRRRHHEIRRHREGA